MLAEQPRLDMGTSRSGTRGGLRDCGWKWSISGSGEFTRTDRGLSPQDRGVCTRVHGLRKQAFRRYWKGSCPFVLLAIWDEMYSLLQLGNNRTRRLPPMARLARTTMLLFCTFLTGSALATTYYVDFSSGSDSNNGTSKASPWKNAPGMHSCTGVCASTTINPGDSIILKGGVTWPNSSFLWNMPGGSSSSPVYVGVDQTWYSGSSWTRPILSAQGSVISNNYNTMFNVPSYVTIDNFEITGFYWTTASCSGAPYGDCGIFNAGQRNGQTWENLYIHGWTHAGTNAQTSNGVIDVISTGGGGNSVAHDNVIVGTDVPGDHSVNVFFNGPPIAYNNYIKQVSSAFIVSYATSVHDNHIEDIGPSYCNTPFPQYAGYCSHENAFEDNGDTGLYFYNNTISNVNAGLAVWVAP